jgi:hypothetical protein
MDGTLASGFAWAGMSDGSRSRTVMSALAWATAGSAVAVTDGQRTGMMPTHLEKLRRLARLEDRERNGGEGSTNVDGDE